MRQMLKLSHVKKTFNKGTVTEKRALTGVDLTLNDGDFVTVIGGNGAGKSTLLNMIAGVYPLDSGVIELDGTDISRLSESQRAKYLGPRVSGPHARYRCRHADRREPGPRQASRPASRPFVGRHQGRERWVR